LELLLVLPSFGIDLSNMSPSGDAFFHSGGMLLQPCFGHDDGEPSSFDTALRIRRIERLGRPCR